MGIRKILVPLTSGSDDGPDLARAISVGRALGSHVEAVFMRPDPETAYVYTGMPPSDRTARQIRQRIDEAGKAAALRARDSFRRLCRDANLPEAGTLHPHGRATSGWHEITGDPASVFPEAARNADLAVFAGTVTPNGLLFGNLLEATLLRSGNPVLFLPGTGGAEVFDRPLVAWDGGTACARAISAWLSTDTGPEEAMIVHVADPGDATPALDGIADRLAWHGIAVRTEIRERGPGSVAEALLAVAAELRCGLIVMGGYGRFRYSEALFGGVTRNVIRHASVPVLMMH